MESWENKIKNNKDIFDDKELPEGHLERFEALLNEQEKPKKVKGKRFLMMFSAAASVIILIGAGLYINDKSRESNTYIDESFAQTDEFYTTNEFYKGQMFSQIDEIICKLDQVDNESKKDLMIDIENIIEDNNRFIDDIQKTPNEETAIFYMVEHYKINIEALKFINEKLTNYYEC